MFGYPMKQSFLIATFIIGICVPAVYCFTASEIEIFQLQKELEKKYGADIDFYKFLKLPKLAHSSSREITKNLRKLSKKYHPDKNKKYKKLYQRLNLATQFLANDELRKNYDYYLKNGFPDYDFSKGGFFFTRVQPKTWFIMSFIYLIAGFIHYVLLTLQSKSNKRRTEDFIKQCKAQDDTNSLGEKRLFFKQHEEDEGKELLVKFGDVYIVESDGSQTLISTDTIKDPTIFDSLLFRLPLWFWNKSLGRFVKFPSRTINNNASDSSNDKRLGSLAKEEKAEAVPRSITTTKTVSSKSGQEKKILPNGKVIYSRKKD
ncbi:Erj5p NDAI_0B06200 [Naumovozyma dairenensis CBS 421]|uniref:J domain-containing protein n=1 Tax=Naumovozyma dairenensis (strain ATCC 10597 / BCRC 20456 / CBS 421 / NBRC 0211 / NRRL Y-12639) TaxID=1071378 RepID=G0W790_NAUDC|nr:hypothetical protein NDAI_0B06200 [Naumovozyma dairenensis CBS 421]CCD23651.1 hypothetical protein NDAI_0B06200 [Naumovozyma dairenensis CBS 421]